MKIKAVCEATGLTDRTVRYYIEEALVSPRCTDSYLGRKNYDFSEEDVRRLKDIAVLRKFGFTISEIREMIHSSGSLYPVSQELKARKCAAIDEERKLVEALDRLDHLRFYTVSRLADDLSEPVEETPLPSGDEKRSLLRTVWDVIKRVVTFVLVGLPVAWAVFVFWVQSHSNYYPVFRLSGALLMLLGSMSLFSIDPEFIPFSLQGSTEGGLLDQVKSISNLCIEMFPDGDGLEVSLYSGKHRFDRVLSWLSGAGAIRLLSRII